MFLRRRYRQIVRPRCGLPKFANVFADTPTSRSTSTRILFGKPPRAISSAAALFALYRMGSSLSARLQKIMYHLSLLQRTSHFAVPRLAGLEIAMRAPWVTIVVLPAIMSPIVSARADEIPNLDVAQLCRGIVSQAADPLAEGEPTVTFDRCMSAEQADRKELEKVWSTFSADDKRHCVAESQMGGESSYTELITCLEMALAVRSLAKQHQTDGGQDNAAMAQRRPPSMRVRAHGRSGSRHVRSQHRHRWWCPPRRWHP
jgi:hypothetical protein